MHDGVSKIIELTDCRFDPIREGNGLDAVSFTLARGEVCALSADLPDDGHLFLRALATLAAPASGRYLFGGREMKFSDYRNLLPYKKRIGYVAPDSALIVNRSIQENIMLMHAYFDDITDSRLTEDADGLCRTFQLSDKLGLRPAQLDRESLRIAVIVRELIKSPNVLLIERPRDFLGPDSLNQLSGILKERVGSGMAVVMMSSDEAFIGQFASRRLRIEKGALKCA